MKKQITALFLCAALLLPALPALCAEGAVRPVEIKTERGAIVYPKLEGFPNAFAMDKINAEIETLANIEGYGAVLKTAEQTKGTGVTVSSEWRVFLSSGEPAVLSVLVEAEGKLLSGRVGHAVTPMMFDLKTGERIDGRTLFNEGADAFMEKFIDAESELDDNTYLDKEKALPVPLKNAVLWDGGLRVPYDSGTFLWLSGKTAALSFYFGELDGILNDGEGSLLWRLDAFKESRLSGGTGDSIRAACAGGKLPGVPDVMGKKIDGVLQKYKEKSDPEMYLNGERYLPEDAAFRGVSLTTDSDGGTVAGIHAVRMDLFGLMCGKAAKSDCIARLGEPDAALPVDKDAAEHYAAVPGEMLGYQTGNYRLMLFFDEENVLRAVYLSLTDKTT